MSLSAPILPTHTPELFRAAVLRAAEQLRAGEIVALPTETVYGLAANALDAAAVAKIYAAKGRPAHNPIIVHVASLALARACAREWPAAADALAAAFWPGPLTLVLPRADAIPDGVTAGGPTVGLRWPAHPFIQAVIRECGFPLAAPSANVANGLSPTNAAHVGQSLGARIPLIIDGGQCQVGIESTVIDLAVTPARVLRPGMISGAALAAVLGGELSGNAPGGAGEAPRSPGQLRRHYSPRARLVVWRWRDDADLLAQWEGLNGAGAARQSAFVIAHTQIPAGEGWGGVSVVPPDAEAYARALYADLHRLDDAGAAVVIVEALPDGPEWQGIADRLRRAAAE